MPLVTCLCLTRNRREWLPKAIQNFQAQTYEHRELLVVADGEPIRDLLPEDRRIHLFETVGRYSVGEKRNMGARLAGEIIAHWDDDDYSAPGRIAHQVELLERSTKSVTGYSSMHFTDGDKWWLYSHQEHYAIGASLCYRKLWRDRHPFQDVQAAEDGPFQFEADTRGELVSCPADRMMVASIHPGNTAPKHLDPAAYKPVSRPFGIGSPFDSVYEHAR